MPQIDVFNGDADGICALTQLHLSQPRDGQSTLVTGAKRDINLLKQVDASVGDQITVLDISLDKNRTDVARLLESGAHIFYADHHYPGDIPQHSHLDVHINEAPEICTSLIINHHLKGEFALWAVVGAFGDNLNKSAEALASTLSIDAPALAQLKNLGIYINYNGYGSQLEDLHFHPQDLFQQVSSYTNPLDFVHHGGEAFEKLETGYLADMSSAANIQPEIANDTTALFILPNAPWARRVSGVFSNDLTQNNPNRAHAVLTEKTNGNYQVSVRAPINNRRGAAELCMQFPTGGGREAAAGINDLASDQVDNFVTALQQAYP